MERKEYLKRLLNNLLENVEEVKDFIIDGFSEEEREEEEIKDYLDALSNLENAINFYN